MIKYMLEGKSKQYGTRAEAEGAARELAGSNWKHPPVTILEVKPVAVCASEPTGVKFRIASSKEFMEEGGWFKAIQRTREAQRKTTIKEVAYDAG